MPVKNSRRIKQTKANFGKSGIHYPEHPDDAGNIITVSTVKEQEEANYRCWLKMTPEQRFELHYKLITGLYADVIEEPKTLYGRSLIFTNDIIP